MSLYTSLTFRPSSLSTAFYSYYPIDDCGRSRISNLVSSRGAYVPYERNFRSEQKIIQKLLFINYIIFLNKNIEKTVITVHIINYSKVCDNLFFNFMCPKFYKTKLYAHADVEFYTFKCCTLLFFGFVLVSAHTRNLLSGTLVYWYESGGGGRSGNCGETIVGWVKVIDSTHTIGPKTFWNVLWGILTQPVLVIFSILQFSSTG